MLDKKKYPKINEIVLTEVLNINPNSVYVKLEEYSLNGMVHVSELSTSWVKDIRKFAKKGQKLVLKVLPSRGYSKIINLSLKRVKPSQKRDKLDSIKNEKKAEKLLDFVLTNLKIEKDKEARTKMSYALWDHYESLHNAFSTISAEGIDSDLKKEIGKQWSDSIEKIAKEKIKPKKLVIKGTLTLSISNKDGLIQIKKALDINNQNIKIRYISAPKYMLEIEGKNYADMEKELASVISGISDFAKSKKGVCLFAKA
ncbi:MAG: S1 RNA-binding domain-containing protein [archaeon]|nr:S1 RNA-binding domain-containing protein [archaeon]